MGEIMVWEMLILSLKIDAVGLIKRRTIITTKYQTIKKLLEVESELRNFVEARQGIYPSTYLLMYRRIFLCNGRPLIDTVRAIFDGILRPV